jgi:hypothetical protein
VVSGFHPTCSIFHAVSSHILTYHTVSAFQPLSFQNLSLCLETVTKNRVKTVNRDIIQPVTDRG